MQASGSSVARDFTDDRGNVVLLWRVARELSDDVVKALDNLGGGLAEMAAEKLEHARRAKLVLVLCPSLPYFDWLSDFQMTMSVIVRRRWLMRVRTSQLGAQIYPPSAWFRDPALSWSDPG